MAWSIGEYSTIKNLDEEASATVYHTQGMVHLTAVSFANSGKAVFYTSGSKNDAGDALDTKGYLSESYQPLDADTGVPEDYDTVDDDSGDGRNFWIEYDVESGRTYYLYVRHYEESDSGNIKITIVPPESEDEEYYEPDFSDTKIVVDVDGTDVDIKLDGLDPNYEDVWEVQWAVYGSGDYVVDGVTLRSDGYDARWSFDHLTLNADDDSIQPNTQYTVIAYIYTYPYDNGGLAATRRATFTTGGTASPDRPEEFRWADGTEIKRRGQKFDITAKEWCDLLDNINAVREYKGYSKFPQGSYTGTSYYNRFTYPTSGQTFRYQHYNQALNAIAGMLGYGYADNAVKQGDSITADRINLLVEWLNGIT